MCADVLSWVKPNLAIQTMGDSKNERLILEFGDEDAFPVDVLLSKQAILTKAKECFPSMAEEDEFILKHKDEESEYFVNILDYETLQRNEVVKISKRRVVLQTLGVNVIPPQGQVPQAAAGQQQAAAEGADTGTSSDDENPINYVPRVDDGPMPELYDLPQFDNDLVQAINNFGRQMHPTFKARIVEAIFKDMLRFSSYVYPKQYEIQRALSKLVGVYPTLRDVAGDGEEGLQNVCPWFSWQKALVKAFSLFRRRHGNAHPDIVELRRKSGLHLRKKSVGGARVDTLGERARRSAPAVVNPIDLGPAVNCDIEVGDEAAVEDVQAALSEEWSKPQPDTNIIIMRLNLTASARKKLFRNATVRPKAAFDAYPMLRDPFHLFNDMERFFHKGVVMELKQFFNEERCRRGVRLLRFNPVVKEVTNAYLSSADADDLDVQRDYVLAAFTGCSKEHINKWISIGKEPTRASLIMKVSAKAAAWLEPNNASYSVLYDGDRITGTAGEFTITEAVGAAIAVTYLCDLKWPLYVTGAWRFLAETICGLPAQARTATSSMQDYRNLFL